MSEKLLLLPALNLNLLHHHHHHHHLPHGRNLDSLQQHLDTPVFPAYNSICTYTPEALRSRHHNNQLHLRRTLSEQHSYSSSSQARPSAAAAAHPQPPIPSLAPQIQSQPLQPLGAVRHHAATRIQNDPTTQAGLVAVSTEGHSPSSTSLDISFTTSQGAPSKHEQPHDNPPHSLASSSSASLYKSSDPLLHEPPSHRQPLQTSGSASSASAQVEIKTKTASMMFETRNACCAPLFRSVSTGDVCQRPHHCSVHCGGRSPLMAVRVLPSGSVNAPALVDTCQERDMLMISPDATLCIPRTIIFPGSSTDIVTNSKAITATEPPTMQISTSFHPPMALPEDVSPESSVAGSEIGEGLPPNFGMVWKNVYRSSFPKPGHFESLKHLGLKTVLTLVDDEYPASNVEFMMENGIQHFQLAMPGKSGASINIPSEEITRAVSIVLDRANHPILIHCNKGKHRTGTIVGCLRKLQQWTVAAAHDEYRSYSHPKSRSADEKAICSWDEGTVQHVAIKHGNWIPSIEDIKRGLHMKIPAPPEGLGIAIPPKPKLMTGTQTPVEALPLVEEENLAPQSQTQVLFSHTVATAASQPVLPVTAVRST